MTQTVTAAPALDKGLDILELLASVEDGLSQTEIAKRLDRSANEFYRMLDRLVRRGYVAAFLEGDRFALTPASAFAVAACTDQASRLFATPQGESPAKDRQGPTISRSSIAVTPLSSRSRKRLIIGGSRSGRLA